VTPKHVQVTDDAVVKMDLQEVGGGCADWMELAQDRNVAGTCEYGEEPSGSKNAGNFLTSCRTSLASQGLCSME
jgi:hypothetical protein